MDIRRSINTRIWSDPWVEKLPPEEKLVWIYLLTNRDTNLLGIYEISLNRISYETGIELKRIETIIQSFEKVRKAFYWFGRVFLPNWMKNQSMNTNMLKSAKQLYSELPNELIIKLKENAFEGFQSLLKGYQTLPKIEIEIEKEMEGEIEGENKLIFYFENLKREFLNSESWQEQILMSSYAKGVTKQQLKVFMISFCEILRDKGEIQEKLFSEHKRHFISWLRVEIKKQKDEHRSGDKGTSIREPGEKSYPYSRK
jgi:hypothetical protein